MNRERFPSIDAIDRISEVSRPSFVVRFVLSYPLSVLRLFVIRRLRPDKQLITNNA
jgi:hypothetical protein